MLDTLFDAIDMLWAMWDEFSDALYVICSYTWEEVAGSYRVLLSVRQMYIGIWAVICAGVFVLGVHMALGFIQRLHNTDTAGDVLMPAEYEKEPPHFPGSPEPTVKSSSFRSPVSYTPPGSPFRRVDVSTPRSELAEGNALRVSGFFPEESSLFGGTQSDHGDGQPAMGWSGYGQFGARQPLEFEHFNGSSLRRDFSELRERGRQERLLGLTPAPPSRFQLKRVVSPSPTKGNVSGSGQDLGLLD
ncbi:hypothetical protein K491DRAFT_385267 [Lophiostoma macrostomum CBS 122681]|uniref:Uncharacterized protein n=1 Tax=Lophiostoma macrostomum CBS 122681 TaxID=1314788 RepID=A0A6A6TNX4_9PLEO|nr:hypothetical protein K491DRAFT_385267 [Lophiostoma macrostomum CBS 122681]